MSTSLLEINDLSLRFGQGPHATNVLNNVSCRIAPGQKFALVGESGSGKTVTALSVLKLLDPELAHWPSGSIFYNGLDLLTCSEDEIRAIRGRDIAMIFQEPMTALNPVTPIGKQLMEPLLVHQGLSPVNAEKRMLDLLERVGLPEPRQRWESFPHMLSGGQRQRVMIAMALACSPRLLIADEPTTALDVTIQAQILALLNDLQREFGMAVLMITHDLNLVRRFATDVAVMQAGRVVEQGSVQKVFSDPQEDYTRVLINSRPERLVRSGEVAASASRLLELEAVSCSFAVRRGFLQRQTGAVHAVQEAGLTLMAGETLGIVGESGSGKSTLAYCLLRLQDCQGQMRFNNTRIDTLSQRAMRPLRRDLQIVFQDPYASLSPRLNIEQIVGEGLQIHFPDLGEAERYERIVRVMEEVGLERDMLWRYPHEFSGGQRQRIAIARVVVLEPKLIILDEPTSALDVSVQKQVLQLLRELQLRHSISYLFISHDLAVIRAMAHRVVVMHRGRIVEQGETEELFVSPREAYTRELLAAASLQDQ